MPGLVTASVAAAAAAGAAWGLFEAAWVRLRRLEVTIERLHPSWTASASRISPTSTSARTLAGCLAVERAVDWVAGRSPELVLISGDLLTHPTESGSCVSWSSGSPVRLQCSATTTSATHAIRSRLRRDSTRSSRRVSFGTRKLRSRFGGGVQVVGVDPRRARAAPRGRTSAPMMPTCASSSPLPARVRPPAPGLVRPRADGSPVRSLRSRSRTIREDPAGAPQLAVRPRQAYRKDGSVMHVSPGFARRSSRSGSARGRRRRN